MPFFRKKPVLIEAIEFLGEDRLGWRFRGMPDWLKAALNGEPGEPGSIWDDLHGLVIGTLEGHLTLSSGDMIIRGTAGEIYPCKPEIFAAIYEPVEPEVSA